MTRQQPVLCRLTIIWLLTTRPPAQELEHEVDVVDGDERRRQEWLCVVLHHKEVHAKLPDLNRVLLHIFEYVAAEEECALVR